MKHDTFLCRDLSSLTKLIVLLPNPILFIVRFLSELKSKITYEADLKGLLITDDGTNFGNFLQSIRSPLSIECSTLFNVTTFFIFVRVVLKSGIDSEKDLAQFFIINDLFYLLFWMIDVSLKCWVFYCYQKFIYILTLGNLLSDPILYDVCSQK